MVGFISSSNLILFNGVKNLLAAIFTFPSVIALKFIRKEDIEKYTFGKEGMEPIVAIVQYCALIYICISNVITAVHFLLSGGYIVAIGTGIMYAFVSTVLKKVAFVYLKRLIRDGSTTIAEVEVVGWQFEGYVGIGILASFIFSIVLEIMGVFDMLSYVDLLMNMIVALIFGIIPLIAIKDCIKELLHATPNKETCNSIIERVANSEKSL